MTLDFAIEVKNLRKEFPVGKSYRDFLIHPFTTPKVTALDGVSLRVREGELFVLLGPNGAGKTTLIKILTTLLLPTEGEAWVNGLEVKKAPQSVRGAVGYCLGSQRSFYWRLTGRQNLLFFAALNNLGSEAHARSEQVLGIVGLEEVADRIFATYSAGMRQLLGIARALLTNPSIVFIDEPTKSLDPAAADRIQGFIKGHLVGTFKKTVFCATHNLGEARYLADSFAIISKGKLRVSGRADELLKTGSLKETFLRAVEE